MTDLIYDFITQGVDMIISAAILSSVIILLTSANQITSVSAMQQAAAEKADYYREFNQFDNNDVVAADIIGTIIYYKYELTIVVNFTNGDKLYTDPVGGGIYYYISSSATTKSINASELSEYVPIGSGYHANLWEETTPAHDATPSPYYTGNIITGIKFQQK